MTDHPRLLSRLLAPSGHGHPARTQRALLLVDGDGQITGGYSRGKPLDAATAQALADQPGWEEIKHKENN